eukprot:12899094-Prorocentrum_lima.AAC.1
MKGGERGEVHDCYAYCQHNTSHYAADSWYLECFPRLMTSRQPAKGQPRGHEVSRPRHAGWTCTDNWAR